MPTRIPLIARAALTYHGQAIPKGGRFDATAIEAAVLHYQGRAAFDVPATPPPDPPKAKPKPKRRTYRRRDLTPEP